MFSIRRIMEMENLFDQISQTLLSESISLKQLYEMDEQIKQLEAYYTSPLWKEDFDADCRKLLPEDLKRGILSEDGIYLLLEKYSELKRELLIK